MVAYAGVSDKRAIIQGVIETQLYRRPDSPDETEVILAECRDIWGKDAILPNEDEVSQMYARTRRWRADREAEGCPVAEWESWMCPEIDKWSRGLLSLPTVVRRGDHVEIHDPGHLLSAAERTRALKWASKA